MTIQEVIEKWDSANEIEEFTLFELAQMLDFAIQFIKKNDAECPYCKDKLFCGMCGRNISQLGWKD